MTQIDRVYSNRMLGPTLPGARPPAAASTPATVKTQDHVEFSEAGQLLSKMSELPDIRTDKVQQVRQAILQGNYETPDKIDVVVDKILSQFGAESEG